jgi:hypothetical protein
MTHHTKEYDAAQGTQHVFVLHLLDRVSRIWSDDLVI